MKGLIFYYSYNLSKKKETKGTPPGHCHGVIYTYVAGHCSVANLYSFCHFLLVYVLVTTCGDPMSAEAMSLDCSKALVYDKYTIILA